MRMHYERDSTGEFTGITVCDIDGAKGYAFCYPDKVHHYDVDDRGIILEAFSFERGDDFNKKIGRQIAEGRAGKVREGKNPKDIYSPRMLSKIKDYTKRNEHLFSC